MAIPSGSGTEVLHRGALSTQSNDPTSFKFDGTLSTVGTETDTVPTNHIVTVLSIIFCEEADADEILYLRTFTNAAMNAGDHWFLRSQALGGMQTFVWNDRFSFSGELYLGASTQASGNVDIHTTYIDQDWT